VHQENEERFGDTIKPRLGDTLLFGGCRVSIFEPQTENPRVGGSIPPLATISNFPDFPTQYYRCPERPTLSRSMCQGVALSVAGGPSIIWTSLKLKTTLGEPATG
jgi:hypothetical protein